MSQPEPSTVMISLTVKNQDVGPALDFYTKAFGAKELFRMAAPDGTIAHAEFLIGNSHMFLSGEDESWQALAIAEGTAAPCLFAINTEDCDAALKQAVETGATVVREPETYFWGVRCGMVKDDWGYRWNFRQKVEDVAPEEIERRAKELYWK
ncbi:MAG: VOC family protein [Verrucomicrobiota bacterium]